MKKNYIAPSIETEYFGVVATPIAQSVTVNGSSNAVIITDTEVGDDEDVLVKGQSYDVWADIWE